MNWVVTIGLETHVQLNTESKIFSGAPTTFGSPPNSQASFIDLALPGVLPVINRKAVEYAIRFGLATGGKINPNSIFARKNYFYPDLPKGYQISQFEHPIIEGGAIKIRDNDKTVRLTRAHLEEDAGKSLHDKHPTQSGIDLNRAGTPLLEIVTEPDIESSEEAVNYAKTLHELVTWIGICSGNMQEGNFRCDANVSIRDDRSSKLGTRREIKNLNSFRFLKAAIDYEVDWQIAQLEDGNDIEQATVLYDSIKNETRLMRSKEDAHDYRYFADPDLLPLKIDPEITNKIRSEMPELPEEVKTRFEANYGLASTESIPLSANRATATFFENTLFSLKQTELKNADNMEKLVANWILGELFAKLNKEGLDTVKSPIKPEDLAKLIARQLDGTLSSKMAKKVFAEVWDTGKDVDQIISASDLQQITDSSKIDKIVIQIVSDNSSLVDDYKSGKEKAFNALIGQIMKITKGKADPKIVSNLLKKKLQG